MTGDVDGQGALVEGSAGEEDGIGGAGGAADDGVLAPVGGEVVIGISGGVDEDEAGAVAV